MPVFALATLAPLPLLAAGLAWGGAWVLAALGYMTVLTAALDLLARRAAADAPEGVEFPGAGGLLVGLAVAHLIALPGAVHAVAGDSGLSGWERAALFLGFGLFFGQVSNPVAHELIHRGDRWLFRLGMAVYTTMLFGHHTSAHRLVHHRHAASDLDPNSARRGESCYRFAVRAWVGSFRAGLRVESARQGRARLHPYVVYIGGAALALAAAGAIAGWPGVAVWAGLSAHATFQLLLSDYVQHYGLRRAVLPDGRLEPVDERHSWNAPHRFSAAVMLNAPRHSDHHAHPARPYPALRLPGPDRAPRLPHSLPVCCTIALFPRAWRRMMHPRLAPWQGGAR